MVICVHVHMYHMYVHLYMLYVCAVLVLVFVCAYAYVCLCVTWCFLKLYMSSVSLNTEASKSLVLLRGVWILLPFGSHKLSPTVII